MSKLRAAAAAGLVATIALTGLGVDANVASASAPGNLEQCSPWKKSHGFAARACVSVERAGDKVHVSGQFIVRNQTKQTQAIGGSGALSVRGQELYSSMGAGFAGPGSTITLVKIKHKSYDVTSGIATMSGSIDHLNATATVKF